MELALDTIDRQFGEHGRMPDCIKSTRYVRRDGPDFNYERRFVLKVCLDSDCVDCRAGLC